MKQFYFCSVFNIFKCSKEFYINYKKHFFCDRCINTIESINEISSPIFSIDDDIQINSINNIIFLFIDIAVMYLVVQIA